MRWRFLGLWMGWVVGAGGLAVEEDLGGLRWRDIPEVVHRFVSDAPSEIRFRYRNPNGGPVRIERVTTDCECTVGTGQGRVIRSGEEGELVLKQRGKTKVGEQTRRLRVATDFAPIRPAEITFRILTHEDPALEPRVLTFRDDAVQRARLSLPAGVAADGVRVEGRPKRFDVRLRFLRGGVEIEAEPRGESSGGEPVAAEMVVLNLGFPEGTARRETLFLRRVKP
jgi:hypothetical protein